MDTEPYERPLPPGVTAALDSRPRPPRHTNERLLDYSPPMLDVQGRLGLAGGTPGHHAETMCYRVCRIQSVLVERGVIGAEPLEELVALLMRAPSTLADRSEAISGLPRRDSVGMGPTSKRPSEGDEPGGHEPWHARVVGLTLQLLDAQEIELSQFRQRLDVHIGVWERANADARGRGLDAFAHWVSALEQLTLSSTVDL